MEAKVTLLMGLSADRDHGLVGFGLDAKTSAPGTDEVGRIVGKSGQAKIPSVHKLRHFHPIMACRFERVIWVSTTWTG